MSKYLYILFLLLMSSCAKYQVVQEVKINMYHMHNPKKGAEVILTKEVLEVGKWYRLKSIKQVDINK
ncbi:MAG: hypothetical protein CMH79_05060 [Nitrospinae bacterium]|nr:hypothetical protein [Nitrospinota bacterium]